MTFRCNNHTSMTTQMITKVQMEYLHMLFEETEAEHKVREVRGRTPGNIKSFLSGRLTSSHRSCSAVSPSP